MYGKTQKVKTPQKALETLEWLSSKMERCTFDVRRSLFRWGVSDTQIQNDIIAKLQRDGFLSDSRYAGAYVRDKLISGRWGEAKIRAGLRAKGISSEIINRAISENVESDKLNEKLEQNIRKHYNKEKDKAENTYALRTKLFRRAASQGFDLDEVNSIISKILNEN